MACSDSVQAEETSVIDRAPPQPPPPFPMECRGACCPWTDRGDHAKIRKALGVTEVHPQDETRAAHSYTDQESVAGMKGSRT